MGMGEQAPHEMTLCIGVYGEPPFGVPVSPLWAPFNFEKSGYASGVVNVDDMNMFALLTNQSL